MPETDHTPAEIAASLTPSQREILRCYWVGCIRVTRGGSTCRAFARRGLTWPDANFVLTELGREVAEVLRRENPLYEKHK